MYWKIYHVDTGKIVKAGFDNEDDAKDWLEAREADLEDVYMIEEMDQDEEDEWLEAQENAEYDEEDDDDDEIEAKSVGFGDDYYDGADLGDDEMDNVFDDDEL